MSEIILPKKCLNCENLLSKIKRQKNFCSRACANTFNKTKKNIKNCLDCGKPFQSIPCYNQRFCGHKCGSWPRHIQKCLNCGKEFSSKKYYNRKYCGRKCAANSPAFQTVEFKEKIGKASALRWAAITLEEREQRKIKRNKTMLGKYGMGCARPTTKNVYSRCRGGKRADLNNQYFRSGWEANFARFLNYLISLNKIASWFYEPETFRFHKEGEGILTYTPDFKIINGKGKAEWVEIKGWMDERAGRKIQLMKIYYPDIELQVITGREYKMISKLRDLIKFWE